MSLPFLPSDAGLLALQAGVVATPRIAPGVSRLKRLTGRGWALIPIASIVIVVFAIRYVSDTATGLTYLALVAVPPLAAGALGWAARGARPIAAFGAVVLFVIAWTWRTSLAGEAAAANYLTRIGYRIVAQNVRPIPGMSRGEIDIVAREDDVLVFVEVKTRSSETWGRPASSIDARKRRAFSRAALDYLSAIKNPEIKVRFDIVEVLLRDGEVNELRHLPNAFAMAKGYRYG